MANQEQLAILKDGVSRWNEWRRNNLDAVIDLSGADLSEANLVGANLSTADLTDCRIYNIHAGNVSLVGAIQKYDGPVKPALPQVTCLT